MRINLTRRFGLAVAVLGLVAWAAGRAEAGSVLDFTGGDPISGALPQTGGWAFSISSSLSVASLGFWDEGKNGLVMSHQVALWNSVGGLLAQVTVDDTSTPVNSTSAAGRWLFTNLATPITLQPGTFVLGADYPDYQDTGRLDATVSIMTGLTFLGERFQPGGTLAFPQFGDSNSKGLFGPNVSTTSFESTAPVPEPSTLASAATGVLMLAGYAWRRRRRAAA